MWPEGSVGSFLELHVDGVSLGIGYAAALVVSGVTIWWAVRIEPRCGHKRTYCAGETQSRWRLSSDTSSQSRKRLGRWLTIAGAVPAVGLLIGGLCSYTTRRPSAGTFFSGGMLLLVVALAAVWSWLRRPIRGVVRPGSYAALARLGIRNAARNPVRSLLTTALLASSAFLLVAVESFRRSPEADFGDKRGGSGGFSLIAETDLPLYRDPNSAEGRQDLLDALEKVYQRDPAT